ncbi:hypothetical protein SKAU_G00147020 [Synaphobranchus kaupii]|uniref:Uncharacterized protein n=1 Tax=Synaphobranchus kaupii TaxID=118154 RepID=A0A9Q1J4J3_SYNKA|nr:hypothetical protein SKAU_G00147020 [Synaphobranchus kaupii]
MSSNGRRFDQSNPRGLRPPAVISQKRIRFAVRGPHRSVRPATGQDPRQRLAPATADHGSWRGRQLFLPSRSQLPDSHWLKQALLIGQLPPCHVLPPDGRTLPLQPLFLDGWLGVMGSRAQRRGRPVQSDRVTQTPSLPDHTTSTQGGGA